jgi:hypothetical protein
VDRAEEIDAIVSAVSTDMGVVRNFAAALAKDLDSWIPDHRSLDPRKWRLP